MMRITADTILHAIFGGLACIRFFRAPGFVLFRCLRNGSINPVIRNRLAVRNVIRRLRRARNCMKPGMRELFYEEILKAQWSFINQKLQKNSKEVSKESARRYLIQKGIPLEDVKSFFEVMDICEYAKLRPSTAYADVNKIYSETRRLLTLMEKSFSLLNNGSSIRYCKVYAVHL